MKNLYFLLFVLTVFTKTISAQLLTCSNPVICGGNTTANLQATEVGGPFTYVWRSSSTQYGTYTNISGATSSSYITSNLGFYQVLATKNGSTSYSNIVQVTNLPITTITNSDGYSTPKNISPGQTENLKVNFFGGTGPFTFTLSSALGDRQYSTYSNPLTIPVSPQNSTSYQIGLISSPCGTNYSNQSIMLVNVTPTPAFTLPTPAISTVCAGSTIDIPFATTGNFGANFNMSLNLMTTGGAFTGISQSNNSTNPISFYIPRTVAEGSYKIQAFSVNPATSSTATSTYSIYVSNYIADCPAPTIKILGQQKCTSAYLTVIPYGTGYTYTWLRNGINYYNYAYNNAYANVYENGDYTVRIQNTATGYDQTTPVYTVTSIIKPVISSPNPVLCGLNNSATLTSGTTGSGYTYQWYSTNASFVTTPISGETNSTFTTNTVGNYSVRVGANAVCEYVSNNFAVTNAPVATLTSSLGDNNTVNINSGQIENLKVSFTGDSPWRFTLTNGSDAIQYSNVSNNPLIIPVSPAQTRLYSINGLQHYCGNGTTSGSVVVNVLPTPTLSFVVNQPNLTVCKGSLAIIPYNSPNVSSTNRNLYVQLTTTTGGYVAANGFINGISDSNFIPFWISRTVATGTYKVKLGGNVPYILPILSDFTITVIDPVPACVAPTAFIAGSTNSCGSSSLTAYPNGSGFTYQWKKNGVNIPYATSQYYYATQSDNYSVEVTNTDLSYNSTSPPLTLTIIGTIPTITASGIICGNTTTSTLNSSITGAGYTYQWYSTNSSYVTTPIVGATSSSYVATTNAVTYSIKVTDMNCQYSSNNFTAPSAPVATTPTISPSGNQTICPPATSMTLTATGCTGGTVSWNTSPISTTGTSISVTQAGSYSATCTTACGTSSASVATVVSTGCICLLNTTLVGSDIWSNANNWSCGHVPLITEPVQISSGHTITLDVNGTAKSLDLRGILNKQATKVLTIQGN
jgi:hypothetical protein